MFGLEFTATEAAVMLALVAAVLTSVATHLRFRVPAIDIFEQGYRAGWEDHGALVRVDSQRSPMGGSVVPLTRRRERSRT